MGIAEHAAYQTQWDAENRGLVPSADSLAFLKSPTSTTNHDHDLNGWWTWWSRRIRTISGQFQRQIPRSWSVQFQDQEIVGCFASPPAMERADAFFWNGKHSLLPQFHVSLVCETSMPGFHLAIRTHHCMLPGLQKNGWSTIFAWRSPTLASMPEGEGLSWRWAALPASCCCFWEPVGLGTCGGSGCAEMFSHLQVEASDGWRWERDWSAKIVNFLSIVLFSFILSCFGEVHDVHAHRSEACVGWVGGPFRSVVQAQEMMGTPVFSGLSQLIVLRDRSEIQHLILWYTMSI